MSTTRVAFLLAITLVGLILGAASQNHASRIKVEGGWTEVRPGWPLNQEDFFVATEKGHHYIEVKDLPKKLDTDLLVSLEFYYNYKRTRPVFHMTPCRSNIYLVDDNSEKEMPPNKWLKHQLLVDHKDCLKRNELSYNVLLHDAGDVFAWRLMHVQSYIQPTTQAPNEATQGPAEQPKSSDDNVISDMIDSDTTDSTISSPQDPTNQDDHTYATNEEATDNPVQPTTSTKTTVGPPETEKEGVSLPTSKPDSDITPGKSLAEMMGNDLDRMFKQKEKASRDDAKIDEVQQQRFRRMAGEPSIDELCRPSLCNKDKFKMARFSALLSGVPKLPPGSQLTEKTNRLFVNLHNQPLRLRLESSGTLKLIDIDSCLEFKFYTSKDNELELILVGKDKVTRAADGTITSEPNERLLEVIRARDPNQWEQFQRCIGDYMPRLTANYLLEENAIGFKLKPRIRPGSKAVAQAGELALLVNTSPILGGHLRGRFPVQSYLPNFAFMSNPDMLTKFWTIDQDGPSKLEWTFGGSPGPSQVLQISRIDSMSERLDITSRWLAIKNFELLEQPVLFVYQAKRFDWIERIELQFQRASDNFDHWISQLVFAAPQQALINPDQASTSNSEQPQPKMIELPIHLKGIGSGEFRIRLRHHLKANKQRTGDKQGANHLSLYKSIPTDRSLIVKSLAFGDACTYRSDYCLNGGQCGSTGPAEAICHCQQGYSGAYCQNVRPCELLYSDSKTGHEMCKSLGARCVDLLPVLRCEWPHDTFYKKLYKVDADSRVVFAGNEEREGTQDENETVAGQLVDGRSLDSLPLAQQVTHLKGIVNQQAKLVIILAVFIISIFVFGLILIGSMVSRLRKSSNRLKKSQSDVQEMMRRASSAGAGSMMSTSFGRASGAKTVAYNNTAFDVE